MRNSNIDKIALSTEDLMEENGLAQKIADTSKATVWAFYTRAGTDFTKINGVEIMKQDGTPKH